MIARLALNYKNIPYETQWLEYPNIGPTLSSFGIPPGPDKDTPWTCPAVRFPDGTFVMDSLKIIQELERRYPGPRFPVIIHDEDNRSLAAVHLKALFTHLRPVVLPRTARLLLNDASVEYFQTTRKKWLGMSLDEYEAQQGGEPAWEKTIPAWDALAASLREKGGPFLLGQQVTYADFMLVGFLHYLQRLANEEYRHYGFNGRPEITAFHQACMPWLSRENH